MPGKKNLTGRNDGQAAWQRPPASKPKPKPKPAARKKK